MQVDEDSVIDHEILQFDIIMFAVFSLFKLPSLEPPQHNRM